jgi:hypothetical protein
MVVTRCKAGTEPGLQAVWQFLYANQKTALLLRGDFAVCYLGMEKTWSKYLPNNSSLGKEKSPAEAGLVLSRGNGCARYTAARHALRLHIVASSLNSITGLLQVFPGVFLRAAPRVATSAEGRYER